MDTRWTENLVIVFTEIAETEIKNNEYLKALTTLKQLMEHINYSSEHDLYGKAQHLYALVYKYQGKYQQAKKAALAALDFYQKRDDNKELCQIRDLVGEIFFQFYKFKEAKGQWELVIEVILTSSDLEERKYYFLAKIHLKLARMFLIQTKYKLARTHYAKALAYCRKINDESLTYRCIIGIGKTYHLENRFDIALRVYNYIFEKVCKRGDKVLIGRLLHSYGDILTKTNKLGKAKLNYERSLELSEETGDFITSTATLLEIGRLHMKNAPELTLKFCEKAFDKLIENITAETKAKCERVMGKGFYLLAIYYCKIKDYEKTMANLIEAAEIFNKLGMEKEKKRVCILYSCINHQVIRKETYHSKSQVLSMKLGII